MADTRDPYAPLFNSPPPAAMSNLLKLLWDAYRPAPIPDQPGAPSGCSILGEFEDPQGNGASGFGVSMQHPPDPLVC